MIVAGVYMTSPAVQRNLESIGSYIGGSASTLGFVWVIAGFWVQSRELLLQRHELLLQRRAIERSAAADQLKIAFKLRDLYLKQLDDAARNIARAPYAEDDVRDVEEAKLRGNAEAYIVWLLKRPDLAATCIVLSWRSKRLISNKGWERNPQGLAADALGPPHCHPNLL